MMRLNFLYQINRRQGVNLSSELLATNFLGSMLSLCSCYPVSATYKISRDKSFLLKGRSALDYCGVLLRGNNLYVSLEVDGQYGMYQYVCLNDTICPFVE